MTKTEAAECYAGAVWAIVNAEAQVRRVGIYCEQEGESVAQAELGIYRVMLEKIREMLGYTGEELGLDDVS